MREKTHRTRSILSLMLAVIMVMSVATPALAAMPAAEAEDVQLDGIYSIHSSTLEGQFIEPGGSWVAETSVMYLWSGTIDAVRMYRFIDAGDGTYYWQPFTNSGLVIGVSGDGEVGSTPTMYSIQDDPSVKWRISVAENGSYVIQSAKSGKYVGSANNSAHAILTMVEEGEPSSYWTFREEDPDIVALSVSPSGVFVGETATATVSAADVYGETPEYTLSSSDPEIASVEGTTVTAHKAGTVTITASFPEDSEIRPATATFTVRPEALGWEGYFNIDGADLNGLIEPSAGNVQAGVVLYFWSNALDNARIYRFSDAGDGYVYWHPQSNLGLAMEPGTYEDVESVYQRAFDEGNDAQMWRIVPVEGREGVYQLQNKATGTYVATRDDAANRLIVMAGQDAPSAQWAINEILPSVSVELSRTAVQVDWEIRAEATAQTALGEAITEGITFASSDETVAEIDPLTGVITAKAVGTTIITASVNVGGQTYTSAPVSLTVMEEAPIFTGNEWYKDITVAEENREPSHADFVPYHSTEAAIRAETSALDDYDETESEYYKLLSQREWDFAMVTNPAEASLKDPDYLAADLPQTAADDFAQEFVPSAWQTYYNADGTFKYDEPSYGNSIYPWNNIMGNGYVNYDDPQAPTVYNPVGYYRTTFDVDDWSGREVFISFQGVKSAYYVYVNGSQVGYSTDSFTAHDFNITPYLQEGENTLAVKVIRWSIGSYLENQDQIHVSGILRDVYLYSKDQVEIRDFYVQTEFDDRESKDSDVTLNVDVDVRNLTGDAVSGPYTVDVTLLEIDGVTEVGTTSLTYTDLTPLNGVSGQTDLTREAHEAEKKLNLGDRQTATIEVENPDKWFPDTPNLYLLTIELKDEAGNVIEVAAERVGFREIYKVNINDDGQEQMRITGQKLIFRGVNRHDTSLENSTAVTRQEMIDDIMLMKQLNVNALRTSHYPNDKLIYDLADELGIFVYAEANVESHYAAYNDHATPLPGEDKRWVNPVMDRNMNMVELLKNHPSIVGWSYANEATYTTIELNNDYCFYATAMAVLERDPSRLRMYERESHNYYHAYQKGQDDEGNWQDPWSLEVRSQNLVDVHSTQYPLASAVESWAKSTSNKLPYFEQEYQHAMGQSFGSFDTYWDLNRTMDNVQGGFVWDWLDQTVLTTTEDGSTFWGYGGDWIDGPSNADAFCANGVLNADRTFSSRALQMRYVHQQVNFYLEDEAIDVTADTVKLTVVNEYENTSLDAFDIQWQLLEDNVLLAEGTLDLNTEPMSGSTFGQSQVEIPLPQVTPVPGATYLLEFSVTHRDMPDWDATTETYDNVAAYDQFDLTPEDLERTSLNYTMMDDFTSVENGDETLKISGTTAQGQAFSLEMDKATGIISDYSLDGQVVLEKGPVPSFWRAQTYNDTVVRFDSALRNDNDDMTLASPPKITLGDKHIRVELDVSLAVDAEQLLTYDIYSNGEIVIDSAFTPESNFAAGTAGTNALPRWDCV